MYKFDYDNVNIGIGDHYSPQIITIHYIPTEKVIRLKKELDFIVIEEVIFGNINILPLLSEVQIIHITKKAFEDYEQSQKALQDIDISNRYIEVAEGMLWSL